MIEKAIFFFYQKNKTVTNIKNFKNLKRVILFFRCYIT